MDIELNVAEGRGDIPSKIDDAIQQCGLAVVLRGTLARYPRSSHWHVKKGKQAGTIEITYWPAERRAWITVRQNRYKDWIEQDLKNLVAAIERPGSRVTNNKGK